MIKKICFYANSSPKIGAGHIMRCLALAQAFQKMDYRACFLYKECLPHVLSLLKENQVEPVYCDSDNFTCSELIQNNQFDCLVVDDYDLIDDERLSLKDLVSKPRHTRTKIIAIDDAIEDTEVFADIVVNHAETATPEQYVGRFKSDTLLLGKTYALIRKEFLISSNALTEHRDSLLITLGATDVKGISLPLVQRVHQLVPKVPIVLVLNNLSLFDSHLLTEVSNLENVHLHTNVKQMSALMKQSRLAVTAAGGTLNELACMGVPSIAIVVADNQLSAMCSLHNGQYYKAIDARSYQVDAPCNSNPNKKVIDKIVNQTVELWRDTCLLSEMSERAKQVVDGKGCSKIVDAVENLV